MIVLANPNIFPSRLDFESAFNINGCTDSSEGVTGGDGVCIMLCWGETGDGFIHYSFGGSNRNLGSHFGSPNSRSGGVRGDGMRIISCCCETGDRFVNSFDGATCKSASGFKSGLEVIGGTTTILLVPCKDPNDSDVSET
jgi:hypothetical protein